MRPGSAIHQTDLLGPKSQLSVIGADPRVGGRLLSARIATVVAPERMFHLLGHDSGVFCSEANQKSHEAGEQRSILRDHPTQTKDERQRVRRLSVDARLLRVEARSS
jgi:hypothetical protein